MKASITSAFMLALASIYWCNNALAQHSYKPGNSTSKVKPQSPASKRATTLSHNSRQFSLIQGIWTTGPDENALFTIKGNRVIFLDSGSDSNNKSITFTINGDKISINYGNGLVVTDRIIKLTKDSLVMTSQDGGPSRLGRMK
ncbi:lipocalin family protein [Hymenobacter sp. ASUV-10]|uniref:Lipocalin family protein n=1 Tax=Hymenobacter aranciens TaxID=3063996 RepID=A0ABT9BA80_9BACT|nr:lipocalin family protein [Hymenobacter sp. ASUV-10]MDO7875133.1 lipocalin family protein [Hymenobacter sp. ASUV-10]